MRRIRLVAIAIPILAAVAACGGGNQPNPPSSQASTQTPAPAPTTVSGPADQKALAPLFGTWALDLASCGKQALTISAKRFEGPGSGCDITGFTEDWKNPQYYTIDSTNTSKYLTNVGGVKSTGAEASIQFITPWNIMFSTTAAYAKTVTTEIFKAANGKDAPVGTPWPFC